MEVSSPVHGCSVNYPSTIYQGSALSSDESLWFLYKILTKGGLHGLKRWLNGYSIFGCCRGLGLIPRIHKEAYHCPQPSQGIWPPLLLPGMHIVHRPTYEWNNQMHKISYLRNHLKSNQSFCGTYFSVPCLGMLVKCPSIPSHTVLMVEGVSCLHSVGGASFTCCSSPKLLGVAIILVPYTLYRLL